MFFGILMQEAVELVDSCLDVVRGLDDTPGRSELGQGNSVELDLMLPDVMLFILI